MLFSSQLVRAMLVKGVSHPSGVCRNVASGARKMMSRKVQTTNLVPQLPAALGGEVEELRRAVEGMRVSRCFTGDGSMRR